MRRFDFAELAASRDRSGSRYLEFLRESTMSAGIYGLPAGGADPQVPHAEDELYVVIEGRAVIAVAEETSPVGPGSVIFVPAGVPHRFDQISEALRVLVLFAPPETAASPD
jgi:mannose-6-phosphate isomerase-like protein (cupin superfamily)